MVIFVTKPFFMNVYVKVENTLIKESSYLWIVTLTTQFPIRSKFRDYVSRF